MATSLGWSRGYRLSNFSSCSSQALERWLCNCDVGSWLPCDMWDLPRAGIKPVSSSLAGGFLTTVPPGKPRVNIMPPKILHPGRKLAKSHWKPEAVTQRTLTLWVIKQNSPSGSKKGSIRSHALLPPLGSQPHRLFLLRVC